MEQIGRYQILDEIGRGAMGVVYRAQDPAIGRVIAIKTIRLTDLTDPEERQRLRERLFREAQSAGILSHPNIVTIYDIAEENGKAYVFMEFVNGPPLEKLLSSKVAPGKEEILAIFRQTAAALDYAHRKGIVHRDIKPANIMIHEDGQAKITDFGVAKILSQQMTHSGNMMGTPNYMSPEQVQGLPVDGRADLFALAVIAYEVLTGEKPFSGEYLPTLLYKIVRETPTAPQRFNPTLSSAFEAVLQRALAKNPQDRYATCGEFVQALSDVCTANPGWAPLARGSSQSMPTMAGNTLPPGVAALRREGAGQPKGLTGRPARAEESGRNPLLQSVIWVLVGIGLVGLVLLGAQRLLFNPPAVSTAEQAPALPGEPQPTVNKPSPAGKGGELPGDVAAVPKDDEKENEAPKPAEPTKPPNAAAREPEQAPAKSGPLRDVQLLTEPPGATVTVDGNAATSCKTPCILQLSAGRHTLATQLEGYRPYPRIFSVPDESDLFLNLTRASGTVTVSSSPPGASIQINGEQRTQRTPASFALSPGDYKIRVVRNGVPVEFELQVKDGEYYARQVNFQ